ncbi:MAG: amidophosphoribosyltransferase, partial [bacterium]
ITRRVINELEDDVTDEILAEYADPDTQRYANMLEGIRKKLNFTSLSFNRLDDLIASTGLKKECLCTYCWDGEE